MSGHEYFHEAYAQGAAPPWDIGRPQPALVKAGRRGWVRGRVLDVGCGTGENALYFAAEGWAVVGVDVVPAAIARAAAKAAERKLATPPHFIAADILRQPEALGDRAFETVIDMGFFHTLSDEQRYRLALSAGEHPAARRRLRDGLLFRARARRLRPAPHLRGGDPRGLSRGRRIPPHRLGASRARVAARRRGGRCSRLAGANRAAVEHGRCRQRDKAAALGRGAAGGPLPRVQHNSLTSSRLLSRGACRHADGHVLVERAAVSWRPRGQGQAASTGGSGEAKTGKVGSDVDGGVVR